MPSKTTSTSTSSLICPSLFSSTAGVVAIKANASYLRQTNVSSSGSDLPLAAKGNANLLQTTLKNATNTNKLRKTSGPYQIDRKVKVILLNPLQVHAKHAKYFAISKLVGELLNLEVRKKHLAKYDEFTDTSDNFVICNNYVERACDGTTNQ